MDLGSKLFLTSIISLVAPRSATQIIVACMFAYLMVMTVQQVKPYRERANNQLASLSATNIFLFLFTGLLLQTNPDGINANRLLFSVVVGGLTTSIVVFTFYLFVKELMWHLVISLQKVDEDEAAELAEWQAQHPGEEVEYEEEPPPGWLARALAAPWYAKLAFVGAFVGLVVGLSVGLQRPAAVSVSAPSVVHLTLVISRMALPGSDKPQVLVNGTLPGPTLRVPFGAAVEVTVINNMTDAGTSIHWHGMTQRGTPYMDGVIGYTQCLIPPLGGVAQAGANAMVYRFTPELPGTYWYHGHWAGQYTDGLYGALIVDDGGHAFSQAAAVGGGDANAAAYDRDEWIWQAADWYDAPAESYLPVYLSPASGGDEPMPDAIVVNGARSGELVYTVPRTQRQLVRVINTAAFSMWRVSVDGMPLMVVEVDGTAVEPLLLPYVELNVAQRISFVLDWSRLHPDFTFSDVLWFRVEAMPMMYPTYDETAPDLGLYGTAGGKPFDVLWRGVIRFADAASPTVLPAYGATPRLTLAPPADINMQAARPWPEMSAPEPTHFINMLVVFQEDENGVNRPYINGESALMPTPEMMHEPLMYEYASALGGPLSSQAPLANGTILGNATNPFVLPYGAVVDVMIVNTDGGEHPFHWHGHWFWVIATSAAPDAKQLYGPHYVRRDVVSVPAEGWARVRFVADNPGVFLVHCHIEWCGGGSGVRRGGGSNGVRRCGQGLSAPLCVHAF